MNTIKASTTGFLYLLCFILLSYGLTPATGNTSPKTHTVEISQMQFRPAELLLHKGDTVLFINRDIVTHDATAESGKSWKSPPLSSGQSWRMAATASVAYYCSFHPVMKGRIVVK